MHEIIICPICREQIHHQYSEPIYSRGRVRSGDYRGGSSMLALMIAEAENEHARMVRRAEERCAEHFREKHARRFKLWERLHWNWLLQRKWPWKRVKGELFDYSKAANQ